MNASASTTLTRCEIDKGLKQVIKDGLATEAMSCLTEGTFLIALALQLGASNFQIGLLAALPTFTNVFQLSAIWLVQRFNSRKVIAIAANLLARLPLFAVGLLPFFFAKQTALVVLIGLMFIHYFFGSIAGASWNAWMKDLVPQNILGSYFARRTRLTQTLNIVLGVMIALSLDVIKSRYPQFTPFIYPVLFIAGGIAGVISVFVLSKAPEPVFKPIEENLWKKFMNALRDKNFRSLLSFNSCWIFAFNLASPFFSVYMMKTMAIPVSRIVAFNIVAQVTSIIFVKIWGRYSDRFSNKNIIRICIPIYITALLAWMLTSSFTGAPLYIMLVSIHIISGVATAGINLGLNNIGLKLSPSKDAITYLATKNVVTAMFSAAAPLIGGLLADFFAKHQLAWNFEWTGNHGITVIHLLNLQQWSFFFVIAAILATTSLQLLKKIKEDGEVNKGVVIRNMRRNAKYARIKAIHVSSVRIRSIFDNRKRA